MHKCPSCNVNISGDRKFCPLCSRRLSGDIDEESYEIFPKVPIAKTYDLIFKISTFVGILAILVINIINYVFIPQFSIYVPLSLGVVCAWVILNVGFVKRKNIAKNIMYEAVISIILCLIWDWVTGWHGWSLDYVFPATSASLTTFYFIMGIVDKNRLSAYTAYFTISLIGTVVTGIMMFMGVFEGIAQYFAVISFGVGITLLLAQLIFRGKMFISELYRWSHI